MDRLLLAAPELCDNSWIYRDFWFLNLCLVYEYACRRRDVLRCAPEKDDHALLNSEKKCKSLEAAVKAYVRQRQINSGMI